MGLLEHKPVAASNRGDGKRGARTLRSVEDVNGVPYSDGKRYAKFYVPVGMLEKVED